MSQGLSTEPKIVTSLTNSSFEINQRRPLVRFFARYIDIYIFGIFLAVVWPHIFMRPLPKSDIIFGLIILFFWIFAEAMLLSSLGTTLGKWLLNIRLTDKDGNKPTLIAALKRSANVWLIGLGIGFPIISLFTLISSYSDLTKRGITSWDKSGNFIVAHNKVGALRGITAALILLFMLFLIFIGSTKTV